MTIQEILHKYTIGEMTREETNEMLKEVDSGLYLDPEKNVITEEEMRQTIVGAYPEMVNGYGLLDTGSGSLDKVKVMDGVVQGFENNAGMLAFCLICGRTFKVEGNKLV